MEEAAVAEEVKRMDAKRLEIVALYLFPDSGRGWKRSIANVMEIHVTTVRRWVSSNTIPKGYEIALECMATKKLEQQRLWAKKKKESE